MVAVQSGWVTLEGQVDWNYQRNGAETAMRRIPWVKGITNDLRVHPSIEPAEVSSRVWAEFRVRAQPASDANLRCWAA
jgi:osmotically-inducible protein OsmY